MQVNLPPELEEIVKKQMVDKQCDAVQLIGAALHMFEINADDILAGWDENVLRHEARVGFEQLDRGEYGDVTIDQVIERLQNVKNV